MIAKVIAHGQDRQEAIKKLDNALSNILVTLILIRQLNLFLD